MIDNKVVDVIIYARFISYLARAMSWDCSRADKQSISNARPFRCRFLEDQILPIISEELLYYLLPKKKNSDQHPRIVHFGIGIVFIRTLCIEHNSSLKNLSAGIQNFFDSTICNVFICVRIGKFRGITFFYHILF